MNGFRFTTESGSIYEINRDAMTWERLSVTGKSGVIRNAKGRLLTAPKIEAGKPAILQDNAVLPGCIAHCVMTSPVISITESIT